mmetsp:Transcript_56937/g.135435  ORF Transcript_56937/g.135435 Transcript_56937/m.135435 type:complete len:237 (+) Transcript_56937:2057-2767(+)
MSGAGTSAAALAAFAGVVDAVRPIRPSVLLQLRDKGDDVDCPKSAVAAATSPSAAVYTTATAATTTTVSCSSTRRAPCTVLSHRLCDRTHSNCLAPEYYQRPAASENAAAKHTKLHQQCVQRSELSPKAVESLHPTDGCVPARPQRLWHVAACLSCLACLLWVCYDLAWVPTGSARCRCASCPQRHHSRCAALQRCPSAATCTGCSFCSVSASTSVKRATVAASDSAGPTHCSAHK